MSEELDKLDAVLDRMDNALGRLHDTAQGRVYVVGTKVLLEGKFGIINYLHQGATDPLASKVNVRLEDGTVIEDISVTSVALELFKQ